MSSSLSRRECFNILDLPPNASQDEIRQAYKTKAIDNHPDKNPGDPRATERFQRISQAYRVLANAEDNNRYGDDSDSEEEYGGGVRFGGMFMFFRMFEELMRDARREEEMRKQRLRDEIWFEHLFGLRSNPWQQPPHRRREAEWSPPRWTSQQTSGRNSQQSSGRTSQQSSGRTSYQSSGRTSYQSSGRTSYQGSGRTSYQTRGRDSQQTSGRSSQQTSGRTSQQTSGRSSQQKTQRTTPLRKNASRPSKENETPWGNCHDRNSTTGNTNTSFTNQQEKSSKVSDDEGKEHCTHPEPSYPVGGDQESDQTLDPSESEVNTPGTETQPHKNQRTTSFVTTNTKYDTYQPKKLSKKQLLAQQKRRAKEAEEIGKELRKKTEPVSNLTSS